MRRAAASALAAALLSGFLGTPLAQSLTSEFDLKTWDGVSGDIDTNTVENIELEEPETVDTTRQDGQETVVSLRTDILFAFAKYSLIPQARPRITELVAKAPKNSRIRVYGYTDSIGSTADNNVLSLARAKAVAAAIRSSRPDLVLEVKGLGESSPVESNTTAGKDNPEGRAKNRRVELRYQS